MHSKRHTPIAHLHNVRDLGGLPRHDRSVTASRQFWRGDSPHHIDAAGIETFKHARMTTIIDLRQPDECASHPNPLATTPGFVYHHLPLFMGNSLAQQPTTLASFYIHIIEHAKPAIASVMRVCAAAPAGVFFHCKLGKDRTGIISALLLSLAEVPDAAILDDYVLTEERTATLVSSLLLDPPAYLGAQIYTQLLATQRANLQASLEHVRLHYGTAERYLGATGLTTEELTAITRKLTMPIVNGDASVVRTSTHT